MRGGDSRWFLLWWCSDACGFENFVVFDDFHNVGSRRPVGSRMMSSVVEATVAEKTRNAGDPSLFEKRVLVSMQIHYYFNLAD